MNTEQARDRETNVVDKSHLRTTTDQANLHPSRFSTFENKYRIK